MFHPFSPHSIEDDLLGFAHRSTACSVWSPKKAVSDLLLVPSISTVLFQIFHFCCSCCFGHRSLVNDYLAETEAAMTKADTGEFLFDDLRELAANHAQQKIQFEKLIPENISIGLFVVGGVSPDNIAFAIPKKNTYIRLLGRVSVFRHVRFSSA